MPGTRSVTFDNETEDIIESFMDTFHHGKFSQGLRALVKSFDSMMKANGAYREQNAELQAKVSNQAEEIMTLKGEIITLKGASSDG